MTIPISHSREFKLQILEVRHWLVKWKLTMAKRQVNSLKNRGNEQEKERTTLYFNPQTHACDLKGSLLQALHSCCMQKILPTLELDQNPSLQAAKLYYHREWTPYHHRKNKNESRIHAREKTGDRVVEMLEKINRSSEWKTCMLYQTPSNTRIVMVLPKTEGGYVADPLPTLSSTVRRPLRRNAEDLFHAKRSLGL